MRSCGACQACSLPSIVMQHCAYVLQATTTAFHRQSLRTLECGQHCFLSNEKLYIWLQHRVIVSSCALRLCEVQLRETSRCQHQKYQIRRQSNSHRRLPRMLRQP